jgi:pimeloyl-ACP methyl ester carboxylesterase
MVIANAAPAAASGGYPVNWNTASAVAAGVAFNTPPAGANPLFCRPGSAHPYPVVLVHGALANQNIAWEALAPTLANAGYCVYTFTYGQVWYSGNLGGIDDMNTSATQLASFVNSVLWWTGASKVDTVGHSEGGNLIRLYMKSDGGLAKVHTYVSLAGVNSGPPTLSGLITVAQQIPGAMTVLDDACPACGQLTDPNWFAALNNPATYPGVTYTAIVSTSDEAVTPYQYGQLPAAANVSNITLQNLCPNDHVGHLGITYDKTAVALVQNALDPAHPVTVPCDTGFPL